MEYLFLTVGTSVFTNDEIGMARPGYDNGPLRAHVQSFLRQSPESQRRLADWRQLMDDIVEAHRAFWVRAQDYTMSERNLRQSSAELVSTNMLISGLSSLPKHIVLLSSDTPEGEFAAYLNQRIMREVLNWPSEIKKVEGLDHKDNNPYPRLHDILVNSYGRKHGSSTAINMTGGYKGTTPALTLLALQCEWKLYYMHEHHNVAIEVVVNSQTIEQRIVNRATSWKKPSLED